MCRLAYLHFDGSVSPARRLAVAQTVLGSSWDLGNRDGAGYVSWTPGEGGALVGRALKLDDLKWPKVPKSLGSEVLVHARFSTNVRALAYTHPFAAAEVYLVHNGVVHVPDEKLREVFSSRAETTNDSELILKSYLANKRSLFEAMKALSGQANVMMWDARRQVLSLYPDGKAFDVWRQDGVTLISQEAAQSVGVVASGLNHPYEYASLPADKLVEFPLEEPLDGSAWTDAMIRAVAASRKVERPAESYQYPEFKVSYLPPSKGKWTNDNGVWVANSAGAMTVNGRTYSADGKLLTAHKLSKKDRHLLRQAYERAEREWTDRDQ